jgi:hypothetical protein
MNDMTPSAPGKRTAAALRDQTRPGRSPLQGSVDRRRATPENSLYRNAPPSRTSSLQVGGSLAVPEGEHAPCAIQSEARVLQSPRWRKSGVARRRLRSSRRSSAAPGSRSRQAQLSERNAEFACLCFFKPPRRNARSEAEGTDRSGARHVRTVRQALSPASKDAQPSLHPRDGLIGGQNRPPGGKPRQRVGGLTRRRRAAVLAHSERLLARYRCRCAFACRFHLGLPAAHGS